MTGTVEKYQPSNGTEGDCFMAKWCERCERDRGIREGIPADQCKPEELCQIVFLTMMHDVDDPEYPPEWITDENGPRCTAFVPAGDKLPTPRCLKTKDMFEGGAV